MFDILNILRLLRNSSAWVVKPHWLKLTLPCVLLLFLHDSSAQDNACPIQQQQNNTSSSQQSPAPNSIHISAEQVQATIRGKARLHGNVQFEQNERTFRADAVSYNPDTRTVHAKGNVQYTACGNKDPDWFLSAEKFFLDEEELAVADTWFVFETPS